MRTHVAEVIAFFSVFFVPQAAKMEQDSSVASHTRDPLSLPPLAFYFLLALWIIVAVDLTSRYWLHRMALSEARNGIDYELFKLRSDDVLVLLSFVGSATSHFVPEYQS